MRKRLILCTIFAVTALQAGVIQDVRNAAAAGNFGLAEAVIQRYRSQLGVTPELAEAVSWGGRGALSRRDYVKAEKYADQTLALSRELLSKYSVNTDLHLATAVGAAVETHALVMTARGERDQAVAYLRTELKKYPPGSLRARIQKNINLLSLEGKPAPPLDIARWLGPKPAPLAGTRDKAVLLFFWAHWCGDCKSDIPVLARVRSEYAGRVALIMPTQTYGYVANGEEAAPQAELKYMDHVRRTYYAPLADVPVPVSAGNFQHYGASTTPTIVLIDRQGIVRLYHPGAMTFDELEPYLDKFAAAPHTVPPT